MKMYKVVVFTAVAGFLAVSCNGSEWTSPKVAPNYHVPDQLNLRVVLKANGENLSDCVEKMTEAVRNDLADKGIRVKVASGDPTPPAVVLTVTEWDPGNRAMRYLVGLGSGEGHMDVDVVVTDASGWKELSGTVRAKLKGGLAGGSASDAGSYAGKAIAEAIATGKLD